MIEIHAVRVSGVQAGGARRNRVSLDGWNESSYVTDPILKGVWLSDVPLDVNEGAAGDQLLLIEVPDDGAAECEVLEEGRPSREFLILAEILNRYGPPRLVPPEEEAELPDPRFKPPQ
jgi:hypothetical protein